MDRIHFTASPSSFPRPCISISRGPVTLHGIGRSRTRPIPLQGHRRDYSTTNEVRKQQIHLQRLYDAVVSLVYEVQLEEDAFEEILHLMDIAQDSLILLAADERTMDYGLLSLGRPSHPLYSLPHTMRFTLPFPPSSTVPSSPLPITPADDILSSTTETSATPPPTNLTVVSYLVAPSSASLYTRASPAASIHPPSPVITSAPPISISPHGLFFLAWRVLVMFLFAIYFFSNVHTMNCTQMDGSFPSPFFPST